MLCLEFAVCVLLCLCRRVVCFVLIWFILSLVCCYMCLFFITMTAITVTSAPTAIIVMFIVAKIVDFKETKQKHVCCCFCV